MGAGRDQDAVGDGGLVADEERVVPHHVLLPPPRAAARRQCEVIIKGSRSFCKPERVFVSLCVEIAEHGG